MEASRLFVFVGLYEHQSIWDFQHLLERQVVCSSVHKPVRGGECSRRPFVAILLQAPVRTSAFRRQDPHIGLDYSQGLCVATQDVCL